VAFVVPAFCPVRMGARNVRPLLPHSEFWPFDFTPMRQFPFPSAVPAVFLGGLGG
jgi:hypothetical protein